MKYPIVRPVAQLYRPASTLRMRPRTAGNYRQECNHVYAEAHGFGLVMDIFRPEAEGNGIGVVDVISGGWNSDRVHLNEHIGLGLFDVLCGRGFTVFAVAPGSVSKFTGLDMVRHVHAAIRYIKARAEVFGVDPARLALTGASAGGHLAALTALAPKAAHPHSRDPFAQHGTSVEAVGLFFPPTDLLDFDDIQIAFLKDAGVHVDRLLFEEGLSGHTEDEIKERLTALSPARQVRENPPPFLLIHGTADTAIPWQQSRKLADAIQALGGEAELALKKGGGHAWPGIQKEIGKLTDWLEKHLVS